MNFYFTFGSDERYPVHNTYVEIDAVDWPDAFETFRNVFPDRTKGMLNCAFYYSPKDYESCIKPYYDKPAYVFKSIKAQMLDQFIKEGGTYEQI